MKTSLSLIRAFIRDQSGATAIEYTLIGGLVSVSVVAAGTLIGARLESFFEALSAAIAP